MPNVRRDDAYIAERVTLPGSACQHAVIYDRTGKAIEVRSYPGAKRANDGPARLGDGWWNRGRLTWSDEKPVTATARCAINAAASQIAARHTARKDTTDTDSDAAPRKPCYP